MTTIPVSLDQFLENKTCIILGAGASVDFSLPLWTELRPMLVTHIQDYSKNSEERKHWLKVLQVSTESTTVDELAMEARNDQEFHFLQRNLSEIILDGEKKRHEKDNWVSLLARAVGRRLINNESKALQYASNLSVVSLNYDRCFNHYFSKGIKEALHEKYKRPRITQGHYEVIEEQIENVLHPHGCRGQLNSKKHIRNKLEGPQSSNDVYDIVVEFGGRFATGYTPPIFPIDEMKLPRFSSNRIYLESNIAIKNSKYCICIGVSPFGLEQSLLDFSLAKKVFYSGKEQVFSNFIPLDMYAKPFIKELIS